MADRVVAERFRLLEPLGRGGMGTVWRAQDQVLGRMVALKEVSLPPSLPESEREAMRERVLREARAAARLSHSSAVTVFDVLEEGDYTFIAMEMVDSPTLAQIVQEEGPLSPERAAAIGLKLLDTLEAAHAKGIVHRDVKPANVMVSDRFVKLADFGIASVKGDPQLTATGLLLGSPSYMSPEQVSGQPAGPASDLWALGATLYFAVEGRGPFDREGPLPTLMAISKEPVPEPQRAGPLAPAIKALLEKDPEARARPEELRAMLEPVAEVDDLAVLPTPDERAAGVDESAFLAPTEPTPEQANGQAGPPPGGAPVFLPPEAPAALAAFVARHDAEDAAVESPADVQPDPPAPDESPPDEAGTVAAPRSIETTWEDELPEPGRTAPVGAVQSAPAAEPPMEDRQVASTAVPSSNKGWAIAAAAVALLLLAFLVLPRLLSSPSGGDTSAQSDNSGDQASAGGAPPAPAPAPNPPPAPAAQTEVQVTEPDDDDGGAARQQSETQADAEENDAGAPSGWRTVALGDTGYSISAPRSWSVRNNPLGDGSSTRFNGPQGKYLLVDWTNRPGDDALAAWEQQAATFSQRHQGYREIRLERTRFQDFPTAAVWEWTYTQRGARLHAIDLGFANEDYGFALNFQTRADDWESSQDEFEAFKASFGER